jgi:LacI family transcriptional regulator
MQNHHSRTNVIGVVPHSSNVLGFGLDLRTLGGISTHSAELAYDVLLMQRGESEWMANRREIRFLDRRTDGYIFISPGSTEWRDVLAQLTEHQIPVVVCYRRDVPEGVAWVDPDNEALIRLAIDRLASDGHRRIAYLSPPSKASWGDQLLADLSGRRSNYDDEQRQAYFRETVRGMTGQTDGVVLRVSGDTDIMVTDADIDVLIDAGVTAALCFTATLSAQLIERLRSRGVRVPNDMSLISFDSSSQSAQMNTTHVSFSYETVGRYAMEAWAELVNGQSASDCCRIVPVKLVEGMSVAPTRP